MNDPATAYAEAIARGRIPACKFTRLACERHLRDLRDPRFLFDVAEANRRCEFFVNLRHYKGAFRGKPFVLSEWQKFIVGSIFGWKWKATGLRRFRQALVKVPRKNGKTTLAAGIGIQMLTGGRQMRPDGTFEPEGGAEVYFVATKEDQAKIGWGDTCRIIRRSPGFADLLKVRIHEIRFDAQDSVCKPLGSDSDTLDGLNPSCAIKDELHAWTDRELFEVIADAFGARDQPLDFIITTEGSVRGGISDEIDTHVRNILTSDGSYPDETFFGIIFELDEGDDPFDEANWRKANPELGGAKSLEYMRDQAAKARLMPDQKSTFLTKQLNVKVYAAKHWLSVEQWDACKGPVDEKALEGRAGMGGLDLSRSRDMSAFVGLFPDDAGGYDLIARFWLPEEKIEERIARDRVPYRKWAEQGFLKLTEGNVTDFRVIEADLAEIYERFSFAELAYDPMFATDLALRLRDDHGITVTEFSQTYKNYALPCKELVRILHGGPGRLRHGGHPILRWNAGNVTVRTGPSGNEMPDKPKSSARIDGVVALLMALGRQLNAEADQAVGVARL